MYGEPDFETVEETPDVQNDNHVTADFTGGGVELTANDEIGMDRLTVFFDGATLLDMADAYRDEHGDPRDRTCAVCGDRLGDRLGDYCSTACALEGRNGDAQDEQNTQDTHSNGGGGE